MSALLRVLVEFEAPVGVPQPSVPAPHLEVVPTAAGADASEALDGHGLALPGPYAVAEAVAAAVSGAQSRHDEAVAALEARHAEALAVARARWADEEGARLAAGLRQACGSIETAVADAAAGVLAPLIPAALRTAALAELRIALAELLASGAAGAIAVNGPDDLLSALEATLLATGVDTATMSFTVSEAAEVTVTCDSSTVKTRLGAWAEALQTQLGTQA